MARLNPLRDLHLPPINLLISKEVKNPNLEVSFTLICFQRLSLPNVATEQCSWQNSS